MATMSRQPRSPRAGCSRRKREPEPQRHIYYEESRLSPLYDPGDDDDDPSASPISAIRSSRGSSAGVCAGLRALRHRRRQPAAPAADEASTPAGGGSSRGVAAFLFLFILLIGWLLVTAPLSKSLQPIAPPEITLLAADGTPIARNGAVVDRRSRSKELPPHVVEAFIAIEDRRFYSHWGIDPRGVARAVWSNITTGRTPGRQHDHPAARQVHLPHARTEPRPQGARGADRVVAGGVADQGRDPRALSLERLFRRQHLWAARGLAALLLPPAGEAEAGAGGDAGGHAAGAVAPRADPAPRRPPSSACGSCCRRWSKPAT